MTDVAFARTLERADAAASAVRHRVFGVIAAAMSALIGYGWFHLVPVLAA